MNEIKVYDKVVVTKTMNTRECPATRVEEGTTGIVLEIVQDKDGRPDYLVELDSESYDELVVAFFRGDEIRRVSN